MGMIGRVINQAALNETSTSSYATTLLHGPLAAKKITPRPGVFNLFDFRQILNFLECRFPFRRKRSSPRSRNKNGSKDLGLDPHKLNPSTLSPFRF